MISRCGLWVLLAFFAVIALLYGRFTPERSEFEVYYRNYSEFLSGAPSQEKDAYLASEQARFDELNEQLVELLSLIHILRAARHQGGYAPADRRAANRRSGTGRPGAQQEDQRRAAQQPQVFQPRRQSQQPAHRHPVGAGGKAVQTRCV